MNTGLDILAIGDVVVDDFIRLKEASVHCRIDKEECEICMRWGDKIPFEFSVHIPGVGNAANAAVCASRLGLSSALQADIGHDILGAECITSLETEGVSTELIGRIIGKHTNYHYVLWFESERTILVKHETFEYSLPVLTTPPQWVYLTSLGTSSIPYHQKLGELLDMEWKETKLAFQPGTFQIEAGTHQLKRIYERSEIFFCNKQEAERILDMPEDTDIRRLLMDIRALGPKNVIITDDRKGAYALDDSDNFFYIPMYPDQRPPYERTGAGDAFASSVVAGLCSGESMEHALLWGPVNAMSVVQEVGAQKGLLSRKLLDQYLTQAPANYRVRTL